MLQKACEVAKSLDGVSSSMVKSPPPPFSSLKKKQKRNQPINYKLCLPWIYVNKIRYSSYYDAENVAKATILKAITKFFTYTWPLL